MTQNLVPLTPDPGWNQYWYCSTDDNYRYVQAMKNGFLFTTEAAVAATATGLPAP